MQCAEPEHRMEVALCEGSREPQVSGTVIAHGAAQKRKEVGLWPSALRPLWMQATYHVVISDRVAVVLRKQQLLRFVVEAAEFMDILKAQVGPDSRGQ
eukprot:1758999-Prymnesium_polylepis.1